MIDVTAPDAVVSDRADADPGAREQQAPPSGWRAGLARDPWWYWAGLAATSVAALVVRAVNILVVRPTCLEDVIAAAEGPSGSAPSPTGPAGCFGIWGDAAYSHIQGRLIARGQWFIDSYSWLSSHGTVFKPSSGDPPLFALFLGLLSRVGLTSGTSQRLACAVLGVVGVILLVTLTRRIVGPRAAVIAGAIAAVYPLLWINDGMLLSESLYVPFVILAMHAAYSFWERPGYRTAVLLGVATALAALTRAEALILLFFMPLPLVVGLRRWGWSWSQLVQWTVAAVATGSVLIAPWLAYNLTRFHHPALMTSATGAVLSSANCDITYYTESIGYYGNCFDEYVIQGKLIGKIPSCTPEVVAAAHGDARSSEGLKCWPEDPAFDETDRDRFSSELAMSYLRGHLGRLRLVMVARVGRMWDLYVPEIGRDDEPFGQNVRFNWQVEGRGRLASRAGTLTYWLLLPVAAAGAVRLWRRRLPVSPLAAMAIVITVTAALTFGITRYRVPIDVVVVLLAAAGIDWLARRWPSPGPSLMRRRLRRSVTASPAIARQAAEALVPVPVAGASPEGPVPGPAASAGGATQGLSPSAGSATYDAAGSDVAGHPHLDDPDAAAVTADVDDPHDAAADHDLGDWP